MEEKLNKEINNSSTDIDKENNGRDTPLVHIQYPPEMMNSESYMGDLEALEGDLHPFLLSNNSQDDINISLITNDKNICMAMRPKKLLTDMDIYENIDNKDELIHLENFNDGIDLNLNIVRNRLRSGSKTLKNEQNKTNIKYYKYNKKDNHNDIFDNNNENNNNINERKSIINNLKKYDQNINLFNDQYIIEKNQNLILKRISLILGDDDEDNNNNNNNIDDIDDIVEEEENNNNNDIEIKETNLRKSIPNYFLVGSRRKRNNSFDQIDFIKKHNFHEGRFSIKSLVSYIKRNFKSTLFLIILGIISAIITYSIDECILGLINLRTDFVDLVNNNLLKLLLFIIYIVFFSFLSAFITKDRPNVAGSGIPTLKYVLGGDVHVDGNKLLNSSLLLPKIIGLIFAAGGGLSIGREGPFVIISSIIALIIMKLKLFKSLYLNSSLKNSMLCSAVAAGVSLTFRSNIGAILFGIEVTSSYYNVSNYWRAFLSSLSAVFFVKIISLFRYGEDRAVEPFFNSEYLQDTTFKFSELFSYIFLSMLLGLLGALYIKIHINISHIFDKLNKKYSIYLAILVGLITGILIYLSGKWNQQNLFRIFQDLTKEDIPSRWNDNTNSIYLSLILFIFTRIICTLLATSLKIPAGDFIPLLCIGCAFGRLYAMILSDIYPNYEFNLAAYALIGGACMVGSVTHTISSAVILMELTGAIGYEVILILCVMFSLTLSRSFSLSIYDSIMKLKKFTFLPRIKDDIYRMTSRDVMEKDIKYIDKQNTTIKNIIELLSETTFQAYPVIETNKLFVGCISRNNLLEYLYTLFLDKNCLDILEKLLSQKDWNKTLKLTNKYIERKVPWLSSMKTIGKLLDPLSSMKLNNNDSKKYSRRKSFSASSSESNIILNDLGIELSKKKSKDDLEIYNNKKKLEKVESRLSSLFIPLDENNINNNNINNKKKNKNEFNDDELSDILNKNDVKLAAIQYLLKEKIEFNNRSSLMIDASTFRISEFTAIEQVIILFELLRCSRLMVTSYGILVGVISRGILKKNLEKYVDQYK